MARSAREALVQRKAQRRYKDKLYADPVRHEAYKAQCRYYANVKYATRGRAYLLRKRFGITVADYDALFAAQSGVCAICQKTDSEGRRLAVDHEHVSGRIRGLLCRKCNVTLGFIEAVGLGPFSDYIKSFHGG